MQSRINRCQRNSRGRCVITLLTEQSYFARCATRARRSSEGIPRANRSSNVSLRLRSVPTSVFALHARQLFTRTQKANIRRPTSRCHASYMHRVSSRRLADIGRLMNAVTTRNVNRNYFEVRDRFTTFDYRLTRHG